MNNYNAILLLGVGQIGGAITKRLIELKPKTVILHNLTMEETLMSLEFFRAKFEEIDFVGSWGDMFSPCNIDKSEKERLIEFYYSNPSKDILEKSKIYSLVAQYKPDVIIDAMNTGAVLGCTYKPEKLLGSLLNGSRGAKDTLIEVMLNDFTPKLINFVCSLKIAMQEFKIKKYIKISTTGIGGMGMDMRYTHGDTPKAFLSYALMGKISAAGVLHQLLWGLSHTPGLNISLVIPATFVGYNNTKYESIETDAGLVKKVNSAYPINIVYGEQLEHTATKTDKYLAFPVVRAGENHVYSQYEMTALTATGQMECITKEEVADIVIKNIKGEGAKNILSFLDYGMLEPTYAGRAMREKVLKEMTALNYKYGAVSVATGNLGPTVSKQLFELHLIRRVVKTLTEAIHESPEHLHLRIEKEIQKDKNLLNSILALGLPVILTDRLVFTGTYSLCPSKDEDNTMTPENIEKWVSSGWVDLRVRNILRWQNILDEIKKDAHRLRDNEVVLSRDPFAITEDFNIGEVLAYYYNLSAKGRRTLNI